MSRDTIAVRFGNLPVFGRRLAKAGHAARLMWLTWRAERRMAGPKILRAFADSYPNAFFIEVGANDGHQHDHLHRLLEQKPWSGIMVEPVPFVFERLCRNYGGRHRIRLENLAVADRNGSLPFYHLEQVDDPSREGLPSWYDGIGSFSREVVLNHASLIPGLERRMTCVEVPCLTFESLCSRCEVSHVDLLIVDTEGYDREILTTLDWNRHRPRLVVFEHYHLGSGEREELSALLVELGYELKSEGFDTWCLLRADDQLTKTFRTLAPAVPLASAKVDR